MGLSGVSPANWNSSPLTCQIVCSDVRLFKRCDVSAFKRLERFNLPSLSLSLEYELSHCELSYIRFEETWAHFLR